MSNNLITKILERELSEKNLIYPFVSDLTQREKAVLSLREQGKTFGFIGGKLGITRQRVEQIERKAKAKLDFQRKIVYALSERLGECLFTEREIECAFLKTLKSQKYASGKLEWLKFNRNLWEIKKVAKK